MSSLPPTAPKAVNRIVLTVEKAESVGEPVCHMQQAWYSADDEEDSIDVRFLGAAICGVGRALICDTGIVNRAIAGKAWNAP
jgi:hypothetical protein